MAVLRDVHVGNPSLPSGPGLYACGFFEVHRSLLSLPRDVERGDSVPDVVRVNRDLPWREAAKDADALRPMLLDQIRHEDFRGRRVVDLGTGEGRLAFVVADLGGRVSGVDPDRRQSMHARAQPGVREPR